MPKTPIFDADEDDFNYPTSLLQTQRYSKSGTVGSKNLHTTQPKPKSNEVSNLKLNLGRISDDNDDSLNDSDDDSNTKTGRSSSSVTASQLTPKPKDRLFIKNNRETPQIKPRHTGVNDDDDDNDEDERNALRKRNTEQSARHQVLTRREDEARNQSFAHSFANEIKRQSPTDMFTPDYTSNSKKNEKKNLNDHQSKKHTDSDEESLSNRQLKRNDFSKFRHSPTDFYHTESRRHVNRSNDLTDESDHDENLTKKQSPKQDVRKERQPSDELEQNTDSNAVSHQPSSSRPSSATKRENEHIRRSSYCEDQESVIPCTTTNQKPQSRPSSAKSNTARQQTQSAIDSIANANAPPTLDPLTSNNEALVAVFQPSPAAPRASAKLPPKPKSSSHTTTGSFNKKQTFKVPSRYQEITARVDNGRNSASTADLTRSVERALQKELQSKQLPRPQSARSRKQSANSNNSVSLRRRSSSAYEHVQPRINTNRSINLDELDTSRLRNDSSQSIKDTAYLEWLKSKETKRKLEKEKLQYWEKEKAKQIDKSKVERQVYQNAQNLEKWRQEKEKEIIKKRNEEMKLKREEEENNEQKKQQAKDNIKAGFEEWKARKDEQLAKRLDEAQNKKEHIEKEQEEKQKKVLEAEKAYDKWINKKNVQTKKQSQSKKRMQEDQLKTLRENEETKFVSAQEAYEKWLQEKEKYDNEEKLNGKRRNSFTNKQQQVPFLPGGSQKNTGKIRHAVW